ncbi:hypothetical protein ACQPXH_15645 [Nocardia sp. CA-135953]|uniref:hypothetical protein n=1 Tax=Nocardia sp. CA-135953 TaxID=3239978 RepID=UPI003D98C36B
MPTDTDTPTTDTDIGEDAVIDTAHDVAIDPHTDTDVAAEFRGSPDELCKGPTANPADLEIDENVRKTFRLEDHPDVTDSIREPLPPGADQIAYVDIDDTIRRTYGYAEQGAGIGYSKSRATR